jgi:hypothetical protein
MSRIRQGEVDNIVGVVGLPQAGKTAVATTIALDWQQRYGGHIFTADPNGNLPRKLHNGRETGVIRHADFSAMRHHLATEKMRRPMIHAVRTADATPLLRVAFAIAEASLSPEDSDGERYGTPATLHLNELVIWQQASEGRLGDDLEELLTQRRHKHVNFVFETQSPARIHYLCFELATELHIHRLDSEDAQRRLRKGGVPRRIVEHAATLPAPPMEGEPRRPEHSTRIHWRRGAAEYYVIDGNGRKMLYRLSSPEQPARLKLP